MKRMKVPYSIVVPLIVCALATVTFAQHGTSQIEQPDAGCDALSGSVPDNVRSVATTLNICGDVQRVLLQGRSRIAPPGVLEKQIVPEEQGQSPSSSEAERSLKDAIADLEARQRISEAISRATLDSNLVSLQLRNVILERQVASFNSEQRAYRRTKILNAFLGTTVGAVGSGLQFSGSVSVQHAGDGISVAGGAITAVFALCTAGIDEKDNPPDDPLSQALRNDNEGHQVPDHVWSYLKSEGALPALAETMAAVGTPQRKWLSCHIRGAPTERKFAYRESALSVVNNTLMRMNNDLSDLSSVTSH